MRAASERVSSTSEQTCGQMSDWPSTYIWILGCSEPQCAVPCLHHTSSYAHSFCSITDEDMLLLHNRIPRKDLDLQFSNSRALRAPKVFFFFLAPILLFNYMGSLRDVHQLSLTNEARAWGRAIEHMDILH